MTLSSPFVRTVDYTTQVETDYTALQTVLITTELGVDSGGIGGAGGFSVAPDLLQIYYSGPVAGGGAFLTEQATAAFAPGTFEPDTAGVFDDIDSSAWSYDLIAHHGGYDFTGYVNGVTVTLSDQPFSQPLGVMLSDLTLYALPEPATWAMMITGFGMVGGAARRRARAPA